MPSAIERLPSCMTALMNLETTLSPYLASGRTSRLIAARRRDIGLFLLLRPFRAVLGTALATIFHPLGVERAANDVIAHTGKVFHAAATDHDDGVLLKVMA